MVGRRKLPRSPTVDFKPFQVSVNFVFQYCISLICVTSNFNLPPAPLPLVLFTSHASRIFRDTCDIQDPLLRARSASVNHCRAFPMFSYPLLLLPSNGPGLPGVVFRTSSSGPSSSGRLLVSCLVSCLLARRLLTQLPKLSILGWRPFFFLST